MPHPTHKTPTAQVPEAARNAGNRWRNLVFLFLSNTVSGFAQGITIIAIPWFIVHDLGSPGLNTGLMGGIQLFIVFWGLFAGTLVDRYNRQYLFLSINAIGAVVLGGIAFTGHQLEGGLPVPLLGLILVTTYMIFTIHYPNMYAFVQELFDKRWYGRVNSGIEMQGQLTNAMGMAAGSVLISGAPEELPQALNFLAPSLEAIAPEPWALPEIFTLNASTYCFAVLMISFIRYKPGPPKPRERVLDRIRIGINYLRNDKPLIVFGLCSYMIFTGVLVFFPVLLPSYVDNVLQTEGLYMGLSESSFALGALTSAVLGLSLANAIARSNKIRLIAILLLLGFLTHLFLGLMPSEFRLLGLAALFGLLNAGARILRLTYILMVVPNYVIGRVNSIFSITNGLFRAMLILAIIPAFGGLGDAWQARSGVLVLAAINLTAFVLIICYYPKFDKTAAYG